MKFVEPYNDRNIELFIKVNNWEMGVNTKNFENKEKSAEAAEKIEKSTSKREISKHV